MAHRVNSQFQHRDTGISNANHTVGSSRHRWYFYKEGFSPDLVNIAISNEGLKAGDTIIDPFNGSGTVTLTASQRGIDSVGFEVNPFTSFLAKTKTITPKKKDLIRAINKTKDSCFRNPSKSYLEGFSTFSKTESGLGSDKWLFNTDVLRTFEGGLRIHRSSKSYISQLMKLALINAAMKNCNARRDGKCFRYRDSWKSRKFDVDSFIDSFERISSFILEDIQSPLDLNPKIITGDSRKLISKLDGKFKLCVTSPPYLNTFDYTDIYRPELFLGEFTKTSKELYDLRFKTVRSHVQVAWDSPKKSDFGILFNDIYQKIVQNQEALMVKNILPMIRAYFEDMKSILLSLRLKAHNDASLWLVVSTSAYANQHVPVDLILADIATASGWKLREVGVLREIRKRKTRHSPDIDMLRESVVILDASSI